MPVARPCEWQTVDNTMNPGGKQ